MKTFKEYINNTDLTLEDFVLENKIEALMDTIRYHVGPVSKGSVITKALRDKTAKEVSKEHSIPIEHATKFVKDYCSNF